MRYMENVARKMARNSIHRIHKAQYPEARTANHNPDLRCQAGSGNIIAVFKDDKKQELEIIAAWTVNEKLRQHINEILSRKV